MKSGDVYKLEYGTNIIYFIVIGWVDDECEISIVDNPYDDHILNIKMNALLVTNTLSKETLGKHLGKFTFIRHFDEDYEAYVLENPPYVRK